MTTNPATDRVRERLFIRPVPLTVACAFVADHHRHHRAPQGHKFSLGVLAGDGRLAGVAIVGRPVARALDNGLTVEVTRCATDGSPNACSALYGAAWRTARAAGYRRAITYTQGDEAGVSLRAAGWRKVKDLPARTGWDTPARPRTDHGNDNVTRSLWEITTHDAEPLPDLRDETRDETPRRRARTKRCACGADLPAATTGRPSSYCSPACRQRAYRTRQTRRRTP
ncbi:XF1762 family protein [Streptacidiphilus anmyonensis]|uniref:XF1762 family protein n=1 Tax=Streptacidiphilus anmyonensis TaxID=405782 RepID=UPI0007C75F29|nr:XF1762 family protein [Streptacidiphilus anmyonensis]